MQLQFFISFINIKVKFININVNLKYKLYIFTFGLYISLQKHFFDCISLFISSIYATSNFALFENS